MFLEDLKELQRREGLTDQQLADKLGIHRVSWQRIKNGRVPVSDKFLVRVNRIFPELGIFLPSDATNHGKEATQNTSQNAPGQKIQGLGARIVESIKSFFSRSSGGL